MLDNEGLKMIIRAPPPRMFMLFFFVGQHQKLALAKWHCRGNNRPNAQDILRYA
jgi:hypothetical protein